MNLDSWLERLKPGELPIFRRTAQLLTLLAPRREELTARDVANVVLADPLATLQIMYTINKKVGERYGTEVMTVEHALMMLGLNLYLDQARRLPILEDSPAGKDERCYRTLCLLALRAQHAAWQARDFAVLHADVRAEEVQVAALLHYAPGLLLWLRAPEVASKLSKLRRRLPIAEAEDRALGIHLKSLGLPLLAAWSIPESTLDLLDDTHADRARQIILAACFDIARRADRGWWDENLLADYVALAGVENTPMEVVIATVHMNAARVARAYDWLPVPNAGAWLPLIPGPWPADEDDEEVADDPAQAPASAATPAFAAPVSEPPNFAAPGFAPTDEEETHSICPMPDKQVLRETLEGIAGHLDGSLTLNQMSAIILKGLHTGLGLTRILFAVPSSDGRKMKSHVTQGIPSDHPLRRFEIDLDGKDLFAQLMAKTQGVWINAGNRDKLWPMVSPALREMIGAGDFYAMSLLKGTQPIGLIYADRGQGDCGLDPMTYTDFKMLCLQSARGLAKVRAQ